MTVAYSSCARHSPAGHGWRRPKLEILVSNISKVRFQKMNNRWSFRASGERACDVEFFI